MEIWRASVDATHDFLSSSDRRDLDVMLQAFLPSAPLLLAIDGEGRTVGFMLLDGSHMEALFIDPACRGQGIGRQLVNHAMAGHPDLTTDVNEQNPQAVGFYERIGFVRTGRSEVDGQGKPYPLLHLRYGAQRPG